MRFRECGLGSGDGRRGRAQARAQDGDVTMRDLRALERALVAWLSADRALIWTSITLLYAVNGKSTWRRK
jgi:ribosomal protein L19E